MLRAARLVRTALMALTALALAAAPAQAAPGDVDTGFAGGLFTAPFITTQPGAEDSHGIATDSQGRVYLSATEETSAGSSVPAGIKVVRLSAQGVPDAGFGSGGTVTLPTTGDVRHAGIVVDGQDRPLILGYTNASTANPTILLTRLTTAGVPDPDFGGGDGVAITDTLAVGARPRPEGIALTPSGQILVAGTVITSIATGFIARFDSTSGMLDPGYGTGGWTQIGDSGVQITALHPLTGGAAFVSGYDDYRDWIVAKVTAGGALDGSFDSDGIARNDLGIGTLDIISAYGMTADSQQRPIVTGQFTSNSFGARMVVMRWTAAGDPDATFGNATPVPGSRFIPAGAVRGNDAAVQAADGKIVVLGFGPRPAPKNGNHVVLARLLDNGSLDTEFAATAATPGVATLDSGDYNLAQDLLLSSAGACIAGMRTLIENQVYTIFPQAACFSLGAAGSSPPPEQPPVTPPPVTPPVVTTPPPAPKPKAAALPVFSKLVTLPSAKKCVSRRKFSIRLRVPRGSNVVEARVNVNGKRVAVRRGSRLRSTVDLRNLPKGRFKVEVVLKLADGRFVRDNRRYFTCTAKRGATKR